MIQFHNGLVEAYIGYFEDYIVAEFNGPIDTDEGRLFAHEYAVKKIQTHSNLERLETYCQWNGIIGYTHTLYDLAHTGGYIAD